ncbi:hypothetical protein ABDK96_01995 [Citricoccus nitrophenolicus]|uniref:Uncharacterized protein n=1 Tax=Citricoccus nitrophenolicus TaxID=863575 RepID=A0ABV0IE63_9MICC
MSDPRAWLAEVQERFENDYDYSDLAPTLYAALTAVLDLLDNADDTVVTQADGVHVPAHLIRRAITEHLGGNRG